MKNLQELATNRGPDRRQPTDQAFAVPFNTEAVQAAVRVGEAAFEVLGLRDALALAGLEMIRKLKEIALRGVGYPLAGGEKLPGVHVVDVHVALKTFHHYAGSEIGGPISEDAMARALAAAFKSKESRERRDLAKCRKVARRDADLDAAREEVAQRVERHQARTLLERATR